jgi:hypothetical protein
MDAGDQQVVSENVSRLIEALKAEGGPMALVAQLNEGVYEMSGLAPEAVATARVAALAALGGGPSTWRTMLELVEGLGLGRDEVIGTLVAVAPVIGTARFTEAVEQIRSL